MLTRPSFLTLLLLTSLASAQPEPVKPELPQPDERLFQRTVDDARKAHEQNLTRYKSDPDMFVREGLLANRKEKWVRLWTRATGLSVDDACEFFIIPKDSGKDYEALLVAFAKPSDVRSALEFIGLKPGRPTHWGNNQYWPKGERVIATVEWTPPRGKAPVRVRAEDLVFNHETGKPLPATGLVFTGSHWITPPEGGKRLFAADVSDSKSIASDYNERASVLDVPRQAPQGVVYGSLKPNPAHRFTPGQAVSVTLEPEHKDGTLRVRDLTLDITAPNAGDTLQSLRFDLKYDHGNPAAAGDTLVHLLGAFGTLTESGRDPFVTLRIDPAISLRAVQRVYAMLMEMDNENGIRIEAPLPGNLYYRAFFPNDEWRDRSRRLGKPWELHLSEKDGKLSGKLILPADEIDDNDGKGDLTWPVETGDQAARILAEKSGKFSQSVYVYAPPTMAYGALMTFLRPAMETHPAMHVFLPKD